MTTRCKCPNCRTTFGLSESVHTCPECAATLTRAEITDLKLAACVCCDCDQLYRRKNFPQWLGMAVIGVASLLFFFFAIRYEYVIAWSILLGSAAVDGLVYLIVGDVVICYRCGAEYRGLASRMYEPFELSIAEKYRQERLRMEQAPQSTPAMPR